MTHLDDVFVPLLWFQARYRREHAQQRGAPSLPLVDNLLKDNTDGCALTALLHFYCPQAVRLEGGFDPSFCNHIQMSSAATLYCLSNNKFASVNCLEIEAHNKLTTPTFRLRTKDAVFCYPTITIHLTSNKDCLYYPADLVFWGNFSMRI